MSVLFEAVAMVCLCVGGLFALVGSLGLLRFDDFLSRLHGPTKATTLGVGGVALGSMAAFATTGTPTVHELLVVFFLFLTAPVSAYLLARAALHHRDGEAKPDGSADE